MAIKKEVKISATTKKKTAKKVAKKVAAKSAKLGEMNRTDEVNAFMEKLDHPLKKEVEAVRKIIMNVNKGITEQWKWAAPTFSYKGYLVTFNLWNKKQVHLVFHNAAILNDKSGLLEGDYVDRRMAYFSNLKDIKAKQPVLEKIIKAWIKLMNQR